MRIGMGIDLVPGCGAFTSGSVATTWNPADKDSTVTLSGGNLIASSSGSATEGNVRTTTSKSSGKYYFEVAVTVSGNRPPIAIVNSTQSLTAALGLSVNSNAYYPELDYWYYNSVAGDFTGRAASGDVLGFAVDFDNGKLWVKNITVVGNWNNSALPDPATNTGGQTLSVTGPYFIAAGFNGTASVQLVLASGSWTGSAPSGFSAWT